MGWSGMDWSLEWQVSFFFPIDACLSPSSYFLLQKSVQPNAVIIACSVCKLHSLFKKEYYRVERAKGKPTLLLPLILDLALVFESLTALFSFTQCWRVSPPWSKPITGNQVFLHSASVGHSDKGHNPQHWEEIMLRKCKIIWEAGNWAGSDYRSHTLWSSLQEKIDLSNKVFNSWEAPLELGCLDGLSK